VIRKWISPRVLIRTRRNYGSFVGSLQQHSLVLIFFTLVIAFSLASEHFLSTNNILLILMRVAPLGIVVAGQTLVIITGGVDLSVGSVAGLTSIIAAKLMWEEGAYALPPPFAIAAALAVAVAIGWAQGWLITRWDLSPFIVTFSALSLVKGLALAYSEGAPIPIPRGEFTWVWRIGTSSRPLPVLLMFLIFVGLSYLLRNAKLGRYAFAIGGNETVARLSGVNVNWYKTQVYMLSSLMAGLAGILLMTRIEIGTYTNGESYPLFSIAAVVIGGTSLRGGSGSAWGSFWGVLLLIMVDTGLGILDISALWSTAVIGGLVLLAALADAERRKAQDDIPPVRSAEPLDTDSYLLHIYTALRQLIREQLACEHTRLYLVDRETGDIIEQGLVKDDRTIIDHAQHIAKHVEHSQSPYWINDLDQDQTIHTKRIHTDLKAVLAVPLMYADYVIGVLELQSPYSNVFNDTTAARLEQLVEQFLLPLEDAWLLDSGWFLRHTREALRHLWDEMYLGKCALAGWYFASDGMRDTPPSTRGQELQQLLLAAIDAIQENEVGDRHRSQRHYTVLHLTYVEGLPIETITERMSISRRQYFYSLKESLKAVTHHIISREPATDMISTPTI
jgi:ribose/xylose/arabinose/galactoside ABC-type transport system permease subunit